MMYNKTTKPGVSIVAHPILPGKFSLELIEVLPIGYHEVSH